MAGNGRLIWQRVRVGCVGKLLARIDHVQDVVCQQHSTAK